MDPDNVITLNISTENLILEGIRRCRAWSQVARGIGGIDTVYLPTGNTEVLYKLELSAEEQEMLSHVNGRSTIEQICNVSYLSNFETCRILWALQVLGVLKRAHAAEESGAGEGLRETQKALDLEGIVETFNQMFGRIHGFLQGRAGRRRRRVHGRGARATCRRAVRRAVRRRRPQALRPRRLRADAGQRGGPAGGPAQGDHDRRASTSWSS